MLLLGFDVGSSSVKGAVIDGASGKCIASAHYPKQELPIAAPHPGWAEQSPDTWWDCIREVSRELFSGGKVEAAAVGAIGISYQMHGLVAVDKSFSPLRPSIIWCDSRAVETGNQAFREIGAELCLSCMLNSPGNFTASKLKWVKENEPAVFSQIHKIMLPGDYIAMKLTGEIHTTVSGLSEGIFWDFQHNRLAAPVMDYYGFDESLIPSLVPTFGHQGVLHAGAAAELGLPAGIPITYRAGDQPNNAFSLNVLEPGDIAATAGTSGVVYGVSDTVKYDPFSRVNSFAHVNHTADKKRLGVLLCVNGTGILNSWLKRNLHTAWDYQEMNLLAEKVPLGAEGLTILPFGNGAERVLENRNPGCQISGLDFNRHSRGHLLRAAQEGIVCAFVYGMEIMGQMGISPKVIRAGRANMFLSEIFRDTLAGLTGVPIELYDTDGAQGAARAAGLGVGFFAGREETFAGLEKLTEIYPDTPKSSQYQDLYSRWKGVLSGILS
ncbi:MAG: FGGY family carbohydrate kinase [Bacteroidia bacterium]|nr:FGGY family carbohydrate kinase [Bacteroidia bacterium]